MVYCNHLSKINFFMFPQLDCEMMKVLLPVVNELCLAGSTCLINKHSLRTETNTHTSPGSNVFPFLLCVIKTSLKNLPCCHVPVQNPTVPMVSPHSHSSSRAEEFLPGFVLPVAHMSDIVHWDYFFLGNWWNKDFKTNDHNRFICELQVLLWQIFQ